MPDDPSAVRDALDRAEDAFGLKNPVIADC